MAGTGVPLAQAKSLGLELSVHRTWSALSTSGVTGLILPRIPGELVLAPDGDAPGRAAARKLADRACTAGWSVRVMKCPDGRDWNDEWIKELAG